MCWATPSSSDNSPIVFSASGLFSPAAKLRLALRDPVAHDLTGAEGHHPPWSDRHFDAGLGIAADALALVAQDEGAEAGDLHIGALGERGAHVMEDALDDIGRFCPGQPELAVHDIGKVRPS